MKDAANEQELRGGYSRDATESAYEPELRKKYEKESTINTCEDKAEEDDCPPALEDIDMDEWKYE
jgi:hypothetical protein